MTWTNANEVRVDAPPPPSPPSRPSRPGNGFPKGQHTIMSNKNTLDKEGGAELWLNEDAED